MQTINYLFNHYLLSDIVSKDDANKYFAPENISETINTMWTRIHAKYNGKKKGDISVTVENFENTTSLVIFKFPETEISSDCLYAGFILNPTLEKATFFTYEMASGFDFSNNNLREEQHYTFCIWKNGIRTITGTYCDDTIEHFKNLIKENN